MKLNTPLDMREREYLVVQSEEFLLQASGECILSGIENIERDFKEESGLAISLKAGSYAVSICLIDWEKEVEVSQDNTIKLGTLLDFIVLIHSEATEGKKYRKAIETFN